MERFLGIFFLKFPLHSKYPRPRHPERSIFARFYSLCSCFRARPKVRLRLRLRSDWRAGGGGAHLLIIPKGERPCAQDPHVRSPWQCFFKSFIAINAIQSEEDWSLLLPLQRRINKAWKNGSHSLFALLFVRRSLSLRFNILWNKPLYPQQPSVPLFYSLF